MPAAGRMRQGTTTVHARAAAHHNEAFLRCSHQPSLWHNRGELLLAARSTARQSKKHSGQKNWHGNC